MLCLDNQHTPTARVGSNGNAAATSHGGANHPRPAMAGRVGLADASGSAPSSSKQPPGAAGGQGATPPAGGRNGPGRKGLEGPLGIYPKSVGHFEAQEAAKAKETRRLEARRELYKDLRTAALILRAESPAKVHAVAKCRWTKVAGVVSLHLAETHEGGDLRASFRGVKVCGNIWGCPVCAARIAHKRQEEANAALAWARAVRVVPVMLTLTARHGRADTLAGLLDGMKEAKRALRQHRAWKSIKSRIGGTITATEMTHGANGWHPHFHEILFIEAKDEAEALALVAPLGDAWRASLRGKGLDGAAAAFDAQGAGAAGDYLAKWGAGEELTLNGAKRGRKGGRTPRQLLRLAGEGDAQARALWLEYFRATSGRRRRQLVWSPGLKAAVGLDEVEDVDAAQEDAAADEVAAVAEWDGDGWRRVRPKRVRLLEAAERGGAAAVAAAERGPDDQISRADDFDILDTDDAGTPAPRRGAIVSGQDSRRVDDDRCETEAAGGGGNREGRKADARSGLRELQVGGGETANHGRSRRGIWRGSGRVAAGR